METNDVRALLQEFQKGYSARDPKNLDAFMRLFVQSDELEVIGTNTLSPGEGEWCNGPEAVRNLIEGDWEHWGDVVFDVEGAHITVKGDVAWLATTGTVKDTLTADHCYNGFLDYAKGTVENEEEGLTPKSKMLDILLLGNELLASILQGETCVWPFRLTAVAIKEEDQWRFHQMQFSFASTRTPDVRYNEGQGR